MVGFVGSCVGSSELGRLALGWKTTVEDDAGSENRPLKRHVIVVLDFLTFWIFDGHGHDGITLDRPFYAIPRGSKCSQGPKIMSRICAQNEKSVTFTGKFVGDSVGSRKVGFLLGLSFARGPFLEQG